MSKPDKFNIAAVTQAARRARRQAALKRETQARVKTGTPDDAPRAQFTSTGRSDPGPSRSAPGPSRSAPASTPNRAAPPPPTVQREVVPRSLRQEATQQVSVGQPGGPKTAEDAPDRTVSFGSPDRIQLTERYGKRWALLDGQPLRIGDVIEMYTNAANGWVRGRFEWSEHDGEPMYLAMNIWDPSGHRDEDGLPPWIGEALLQIPPKARVRRG